MNVTVTPDTAGLSEVPGFLANGASGDIRGRGDGRLDTGILVAERPCTWAGVFTTNDVLAAPVRYDQALLASGRALQGVVVNSGNANACTGERGEADTRTMAKLAGEGSGLEPASFAVCSTGHIGHLLPMERVSTGIQAACSNIGNTPEHGMRFGEAILTSDTRPKTVSGVATGERGTFHLGGAAKGAGMIEPNMATMLAFLVTDAKASQGLLQELLLAKVRESFNCLTVDGGRSTNDTVLLLANGSSGVDLDTDEEARDGFLALLDSACTVLAKKIVGDGERITRVVELQVHGAPSDEAAEMVARAMGNNALVKASWYGGDPNWGRLMHAAGAANVGLVEAKLSLFYDDVPVLLEGVLQVEQAPRWKEVVAAKEFTINMILGEGPGAARIWASDLTPGYIDFNKSE